MTFKIRHLTYQVGQKRLIDDISLLFKPGHLYGILGPNGSGKSTLLKTLSRIWSPTKGELIWNGEDILQFPRVKLSKTLTLVPQNPQLYFDCSVFHLVQMGRYPHGCRTEESSREVQEALKQVNAWHLKDQFLSQLSGGERQRVYIARALVTQAPILLLDEPTSSIDLRHQLEIWQLLRALISKDRLVIVALHDLFAAKRFCDQVVILNHGRCEATGSYGDVMTERILSDIFGVYLEEETCHLVRK